MHLNPLLISRPSGIDPAILLDQPNHKLYNSFVSPYDERLSEHKHYLQQQSLTEIQTRLPSLDHDLSYDYSSRSNMQSSRQERSLDSATIRLTHFIGQTGEPRMEEDVLAKARHDISLTFTEDQALRLASLYFRFVNPYFPILTKSGIFGYGSPNALNALPLSLLSALYATALPFISYDELLAVTLQTHPLSHQLYRISWLAIIQELHTPHIATLQACLLLLQRAPTNAYTTDTPWTTSLVGWTVSLAQTLGLNRECGDWVCLPSCERSLRKRLWYGVYIMDKWATLGAGKPSLIKNEDWDVLSLESSDCETTVYDEHESDIIGSTGHFDAEPHFRQLTELTLILSDIIDAYYSVKAIQRTSNDFGLSLELARPLRTRLERWNDSLPLPLLMRGLDCVDVGGVPKLSANPSLFLAYIVVTITLFHALLRPAEKLSAIEEEDHSIVGNRLAVRASAKKCAKELVDFVEQLGRDAPDAFWHSCSSPFPLHILMLLSFSNAGSRANFAIASSFLMQLLQTSKTAAEAAEIQEFVARWHLAMRIGSGDHESGLMSLGLLRLDSLLLENGGTYIWTSR
jgi:hypothetical protein